MGLGNEDFATVSFGGGPDVVFPADEQAKEMAIREKMDKDRFRQDLGNVIEAYEEVGRRLGMTFQQ